MPTNPMPGLTSPGFEYVELLSPEGGDTSILCVDPSGLTPRNSHRPVPSTPAEVVSGLRPLNPKSATLKLMLRIVISSCSDKLANRDLENGAISPC